MMAPVMIFVGETALKPAGRGATPTHLSPEKDSRRATQPTIILIIRKSQGDARGRSNLMNLSEPLIDEIRGKAYLINHDDDVEGRRESVRLMLKVTAEQRSAGLSECEL